MRTLVIHRESIESRSAQELISALNAELSHRYPEPGANHFRLDAADVAPGRGAFLIARAENVPIGCGAIRQLDTHTAELKRMYVVPNRRGAGVGRELLKRLESVANDLCVRRIVLETGIRQPEAIALYQSSGYAEIPRFGEYSASPLSMCMEKSISTRQ